MWLSCTIHAGRQQSRSPRRTKSNSYNPPALISPTLSLNRRPTMLFFYNQTYTRSQHPSTPVSKSRCMNVIARPFVLNRLRRPERKCHNNNIESGCLWCVFHPYSNCSVSHVRCMSGESVKSRCLVSFQMQFKCGKN